MHSVWHRAPAKHTGSTAPRLTCLWTFASSNINFSSIILKEAAASPPKNHNSSWLLGPFGRRPFHQIVDSICFVPIWLARMSLHLLPSSRAWSKISVLSVLGSCRLSILVALRIMLPPLLDSLSLTDFFLIDHNLHLLILFCSLRSSAYIYYYIVWELDGIQAPILRETVAFEVNGMYEKKKSRNGIIFTAEGHENHSLR